MSPKSCMMLIAQRASDSEVSNLDVRNAKETFLDQIY